MGYQHGNPLLFSEAYSVKKYLNTHAHTFCKTSRMGLVEMDFCLQTV